MRFYYIAMTLALILGVCCQDVRAQPPFGTPVGGKKADPPPVQANEQFKHGVPSLFGQGGTNQFNTPVGPAGSRANVVEAPPAGFTGRPTQGQTPGLWQRFKSFIGMGNPPAPGTIPQQLPPGSLNPKPFGGR